jgi:hypothetical protein
VHFLRTTGKMLPEVVLALAGVAAAASETVKWGEMAHLQNMHKVKRLNNGLAKTPQMGWNGWVRYDLANLTLGHPLLAS